MSEMNVYAEPEAFWRDTFGRFRTSQPVTIFDSKQLYDDLPLLYDDQEVSGGGTTSTHSPARASVAMGVSASTAGKRVRQTFRRFNYQPGKSQLAFFTAVLGDGGDGIAARVGLFDDSDGAFFYIDGDTVGVGIRSSVSGSPVDTLVTQEEWAIDNLDGSGAARGRNNSLYKLDPSKAQILVIDYEWLGVGFVRFGFVIDGNIIYVHQMNHANIIDSVYMSTPNLPVRYEIENDGTGGAATLEHICTTVISEGGQESTGITYYVSTEGTHLDANAVDTLYAGVGLRLKSTHLSATVIPEYVSVLTETSDDVEWCLVMNPTVAGTFAFVDQANAPVQVALGATANTVTGGTKIAGGWLAAGNTAGAVTESLDTELLLGSAIDGTPDELVLCIRPLSINCDVQLAIGYRSLL